MKVGFFEEAEGVKSSVRVMSYQSWWASFIFGVLTILTQDLNALYLTVLFILAAFAPKSVQKFAELKAGAFQSKKQ